MHARLHREAQLAAPGILLAVAQKRIVAQIEAIGPLPRNVEWLHHGAVSGIDSFREVSRIVVVGRQAPSPSAVQACAEALTGATCTRLPARQWYQRIDAVHELTDGRLVATERDGHPDSIAEAFRRRITVLELQQIIGRGLWRTADNPLHVLVLTDVPLEELTTDAAERPSFEDRQIAVGAIAFECAGYMTDPSISSLERAIDAYERSLSRSNAGAIEEQLEKSVEDLRENAKREAYLAIVRMCEYLGHADACSVGGLLPVGSLYPLAAGAAGQIAYDCWPWSSRC